MNPTSVDTTSSKTLTAVEKKYLISRLNEIAKTKSKEIELEYKGKNKTFPLTDEFLIECIDNGEILIARVSQILSTIKKYSTNYNNYHRIAIKDLLDPTGVSVVEKREKDKTAEICNERTNRLAKLQKETAKFKDSIMLGDVVITDLIDAFILMKF